MSEIKRALERAGKKPVAYYPTFSRLTGSITAGLLLSQLVFWDTYKKGGAVVKSDEAICERMRLGPYELRSAKKKLRDLNLVEIERRGIPATSHYTLDRENIIARITGEGQASGQVGCKPPDSTTGKQETIKNIKTIKNIYKEGDNLGTTGDEAEGKVGFDLRRKEFTGIEKGLIDEWQKAYPDVEVAAELRRIREWCICNPVKIRQRRTSAGGLRRTISSWLGREQERADAGRRLYRSRNNSGDREGFRGTTYTDRQAYLKAKKRGEKNIRYAPESYV